MTKKEITVYQIYLQNIQDIAEANIGRKLTEIEIKRLTEVFYEGDEIFFDLQEIIDRSIKKVVDTKKDWSDWDKICRNTPIERMSGFIVV